MCEGSRNFWACRQKRLERRCELAVIGSTAPCLWEINWLDIVSSALGDVHRREMIARVMGNQKFVNTEALLAIAGMECFNCKVLIENLRSFKCHN